MQDGASMLRPVTGSSATAFPSYVERQKKAFTDPWDVVLDANLTNIEKYEILSGWASRAATATAQGASRQDLMEALRLVDAALATASAPRPALRPGRLRPAARFRSARPT